MAAQAIDFSDLGGRPVAPASGQPAPGQPPKIDFSDLGARVVTPDASASGSPSTLGSLVNDVGNQVIVPKPGESFADTMKRAAEYGKTVTPEQINAEMATAPKKAAQVSLAALLGGATLPAIGPAVEAGAPLIGAGAKAVAGWTAAHPVAAAMGYHIARELGIPLPKILDVMSKFQVPGGQ
jgi:hypothetical protein